MTDGLLRITLARPEKKNALDLETMEALLAAFERARDSDVRVVLLDGEGDLFSAGGDISVMKQFEGDAQATLTRLRGGLNKIVTAMHDLPKPIVCAARGAYGAGAILAFQADITLVADDAPYTFAFRHVGLIPDTGGTWLLPRVLGLQRAKYLTWTAAPFTGIDAAKWGLALESVPGASLDQKAKQLCAALMDGPVATMGRAKEGFHRNLHLDIAPALEREARLQATCFLHAEHREGRNAFFARRRAAFR